jgi:flagellar hook-basal body complex protein FliE
MDVQASQAVDIQSVLQQMRQLRSQAQNSIPAMDQPDRPAESVGLKEAGNSSSMGFGEVMSQAVQSVNQLQKTASQSSEDFVLGKETDLVKVMVQGQKASVGFQALVQVRNRMVTAYQDIMNMPI